MKLKINGKFYDFFTDITVNYSLDSVASVFSFKSRFDPDNADHRAVFKPLSYNKVEIFDNEDSLLLTGVIVNTALGSDSKRELQSLSGYSKAGILEDCTIPVSSYPLEKVNVSLRDLIQLVIADFDLSFTVDQNVSSDMDILYPKTVAQPTETVKSYIAKLASQRNIIIGHNEKGNLRFFRPNQQSAPKLFLTASNTLKMSLDVSGQSFHSEISVIRQPSKDNTSLTPVDTISNPLVKIRRSLVKVLSSGSETETKKASDNALAGELKNIGISVTLNRVEKVYVGDLIEIQNPEIYLYNRTKLIIASISVKETQNSEEMILNLVLPESFTGEIPKNIFE